MRKPKCASIVMWNRRTRGSTESDAFAALDPDGPVTAPVISRPLTRE